MILQLRQLRMEKGLTQDQLADMTGLSKGFVSQLETGQRQPSTDTLGVIASALKVTEADLIQPGFSEPRAPDTTARRVLNDLLDPTPAKKTAATDQDFKIGTDGTHVQIIATVDRDGLAKLIKQLEAMKAFLEI